MLRLARRLIVYWSLGMSILLLGITSTQLDGIILATQLCPLALALCFLASPIPILGCVAIILLISATAPDIFHGVRTICIPVLYLKLIIFIKLPLCWGCRI